MNIFNTYNNMLFSISGSVTSILKLFDEQKFINLLKISKSTNAVKKLDRNLLIRLSSTVAFQRNRYKELKRQ